ncbi:hypothetical protein HFX_5222 (plasmid) [Haloferax mediterranei ATCC 33500]|uniref:Uncharacterized protein n=1 Tax=Haloferax mediterranei (strain ATCC 33500 / DSM 1411 / JCM 8866 / NBRC 14739 / NCIMB 2177 / R-4) TaxID=523841 RepID=I3R9Z6_HALMT|nr:hypothetical protein HFX_5222 [Haloferax mediterranei ATCC 33500]
MAMPTHHDEVDVLILRVLENDLVRDTPLTDRDDIETEVFRFFFHYLKCLFAVVLNLLEEKFVTRERRCVTVGSPVDDVEGMNSCLIFPGDIEAVLDTALGAITPVDGDENIIVHRIHIFSSTGYETLVHLTRPSGTFTTQDWSVFTNSI